VNNYKRALTDKQKSEVMERLLAVWVANPKLRLMQLLGNVYKGQDPYSVEDFDMLNDVEGTYEK
jgi:hypothetical protein